MLAQSEIPVVNGVAPKVSFVVPCYGLAHLLRECVESILCQTYTDFELIVMDDCSPDDPSAVVEPFQDKRIRLVRNACNIGHLRNYNAGIGQSRGSYVWLISADDRLRRPYVLERYVRFMDNHPRVGYICCPGVGLNGGVETTLIRCGYYGSRDRLFNGRKFVATSLRQGYGLLSPSVMARKRCYDRISNFPVDMPHQGDWYLWLRWALEWDVAYMSEPMVNYRSHNLNMMKTLLSEADTVFKDEVALLRRIKQHCLEKGFRSLARKCDSALARKYARAATAAIYGDMYSPWPMGVDECDQNLRAAVARESECRCIRGEFYSCLGDEHWRRGQFSRARDSYSAAMRENSRMWQVWAKLSMLCAGCGPMALTIKGITSGQRQLKSRVEP